MWGRWTYGYIFIYEVQCMFGRDYDDDNDDDEWSQEMNIVDNCWQNIWSLMPLSLLQLQNKRKKQYLSVFYWAHTFINTVQDTQNINNNKKIIFLLLLPSFITIFKSLDTFFHDLMSQKFL